MKKIYCCLQGGLGNQVFQYAYARGLALRYAADLIIDDGWYRGRRDSSVTPREFLLAELGLPVQLPGMAERVLIWCLDVLSKIQKGLGIQFLPFHQERYPLAPAILLRSPLVYVKGFWQRHAFVAPVLPWLREAIQPDTHGFPSDYWRFRSQIDSQAEPVFVHVRRGDYLNNPISASYHGLCSLEYYAAALDYLREHCPCPHFFLFSDDLEWACNSLPFEDLPFTPVDLVGKPHAELAELDLMRRCHHAIIANSSFSWWGAVLIDKPGSIVIAPRQWFAARSAPELYAPAWVVF